MQHHQQLHPDGDRLGATRGDHALAAADRARCTAVTDEDLARDPFRHDLLAVLRRLERETPGKPRIGTHASLADEIVRLTQDPFMEFAASNISAVDTTGRGTLRLHTRFLGFFGPQGALPLSTTMEAAHWLQKNDDAFVRFTEIFANRFQQLFFRAWSDARPISQHDRPDEDRFIAYLGSMAGIGSPGLAGRDSLDDMVKMPYAGLVGASAKSPGRLRQLLSGLFGVAVDIKEHVGTWLNFEPGDQLALGGSGAALGVDTMLGSRVYSINEKVRIVIHTASLEAYESFLPTGARARQLADAVFFFLGYRYEYEVQLTLPSALAPRMELGNGGRLGWSSWLGEVAATKTLLDDSCFDPTQWQAPTA
ncbi:type VI secretion system baseplate subunit TssG [Nostoc sp. 3335mG]|nr:type VI secretion system baseplate subunit TssG [Nostoc sp. 3335mG]